MFDKRKEMASVAGNDDALLLPGMFEDLGVGCADREDIAESLHVVLPENEQLVHLVWNIVVQEKSHWRVSLICSAMSASTSVR